MRVSRLLLLSIACSPAMLFGQKHDELVSIQRDVAQLEDQMKQLQKALDDKTAALTALLQQSIDASNRAAAAMQHSLDEKLADQQTKLVAPVATLGTKVDQMSGDFSSVRENVAQLVRHMNDLDAKIADISSAVRSLSAPPPAPPPQAVAGTTAQVPVPDNTPPAGMTPELSYNAAYRDFGAKKDDAAIEEFANYLKYFPQTENAPNAQYYIAMIYYRGEDWTDAVKAFDAVLEKYPKNPKTTESAYMKACALMKDNKKTAAVAEFKNFIATYPDSPRVKDAHAHLQELGMESPKRRK